MKKRYKFNLQRAPTEFQLKSWDYWQGILFYVVPFVILAVFLPIVVGIVLCCTKRCQKGGQKSYFKKFIFYSKKKQLEAIPTKIYGAQRFPSSFSLL